MNIDSRHSNGQLAAGLVLMTIGALLLLDRLNILSFHRSIGSFWPLILIWVGVSKLIRRSE